MFYDKSKQSRSNITISGIWCREEHWSSSMLWRMRRRLMGWPRHCPDWSLSTSGRSLVFSISRFLPRGSDESVCLSDMVVGLVPPMVRCKCRAFLTWWQAGPPMVRWKCRAFLTWWQYGPPMVRCKWWAFQTWWQARPPMVRCKCWTFLTWW